MGFLDRFLGAIKLNDDFDDEDEDDFLDGGRAPRKDEEPVFPPLRAG